jgi:perosamine synthetase
MNKSKSDCEPLTSLASAITENPFGKYNGNEARYVLEALDSENPANTEVPWAKRLEKAFASRFGVRHAIAHNSGTSTLHSCLAAAGVGAGDEVIVPAQTVVMCCWAPLYQNAVPVFADSDPDTFNLDPDDVEHRITPKTKAIIAVHMQGLPADMPRLMEIASRRGITLIEDCAQCVLGTVDGRMAGSIGHMSSFSFETKKHLSTGEGGMVCTNDSALATRVRKHAGLGYKTLTADSGLRTTLPTEFQDPAYKRHDTLAWNYRMPELVAAVGLAQLERIEAIVARRRQVAQLYFDALSGCDWILPQKVPTGYTHSYWTFTVCYEGMEALGVPWKEFYRLHTANGGDGFYGGHSVAYEEIAMREHAFYGTYLPKDTKLYPKEFLYERGLCPKAEALQPKLMQFKTNYRDLGEAHRKIAILRQTITQINGAYTKTKSSLTA